ncbi:AAA family ATPase, partial [Candidatus Aerophobetes bacterium]|nr:AAA family ATPase [Candidatus Aerophobetes bacterium]
LAEATGKNASTIHRLLGFAPGIGFTKNQKNKLRADVVIVDEVSMVDILLANALLRALPSSCRLIFVGDADQLPAVGPGNFLQDMIQSQNIPVVKLKEIFRQAKKSLIVVNAHRINQGKFPLLSAPSKTCEFSSQEKDFYFIEEKDAEKVEKIVISLCCKELPKKFGFDPFSDIQVISPLYKGQAGVTRLNRILQEILNPSGKAFKRGQMVFKEGDKVMQLKNNYEKEVFNGDIGTIKKVDEEEKVIEVNFPEKDVLYQDDDLNQLTLAYAISVHKSQGSEYPVVIMPVIMSHYIMLQRNLIYTALTRAKKRVFLVGEKRALTIAIKNDRIAKRFTKLAERLLAEN